MTPSTPDDPEREQTSLTAGDSDGEQTLDHPAPLRRRGDRHRRGRERCPPRPRRERAHKAKPKPKPKHQAAKQPLHAPTSSWSAPGWPG